MLALDTVHRQCGKIEVLQHTQRQQRHNALAVGWNLVHRVASKVLLHRNDPLRLIGSKIGQRHAAAMRLRVRHQSLGQLAAI